MKYRDLNSISAGDTAFCEFDVSDQRIDDFAQLSGDRNPLHMDGGFAEERGFSRRVAHGMLALSAISRLIGTELPGAGSLWVAQEIRFAAPALMGDRLKATVTVEQVSVATKIVVLRTEVVNVTSGAIVLSGSGKVMLTEPRGRSGQ